MSENKYGEPWRFCGQHREPPVHCSCGNIWSEGDDVIVCKVLRGKWGDEYPDLRMNKDGEPEAYMAMIEYGTIPDGAANAKAERIVSLVNACANRSESEIKAAFALWDNRRKVVEKLTEAQRNEFRRVEDTHFFGRPRTKNEVHEVGMKNAVSYRCLTTALALLQAEKGVGE